MQHRPNIPVLAILGLSFTGCAGGPDRNPIVGEWSAVQLDGEKLPETFSEGPYTAVFGLRLTVEEDLEGALEYYSVYDHGDYEIREGGGTDLVVDDSGAPKYRLELNQDLFGGGDYDYNSVGPDVTSDGYGGDELDDGAPAELAAPSRPLVAPAQLVLSCTLEQDTLSCAGEGDEPMSLVFKRREGE